MIRAQPDTAVVLRRRLRSPLLVYRVHLRRLNRRWRNLRVDVRHHVDSAAPGRPGTR